MEGSVLANLLLREDFAEGECWQRRDYPPQSEVIARGDESQNLYYIFRGEVRVAGNIFTEDGRELHPGFTTLESGQTFGELVLFDHLPRSASVTTIGDCSLAVIDGPCLRRFMEQHKDIGYELILEISSSLAERLRQTNEQLFSIYAWGLRMHDIDRYL